MGLLVVGSVALDDVETGECAKKNILGGSASFFSVGASIFSDVNLVAVVGEDFPEKNLDLFRSKGIDLKGLEHAPGKTFHWSGRYAPDFSSRITLKTDLNVFADFTPKLPPDYRSVSHVFLANIHPTLQIQVLESLECTAFVAADTMNFWINGALNELLLLIKKLDLLIINDEEVRLLGGGSSIIEAAENVLKKGPKILVVKRGEHGATLFYGPNCFHLPAYPVRSVVDPTGAGDTFAAGLMGYLARKGSKTPDLEDLKQAMVCGTALASFAVEGFSLEGLIPVTVKDVYERYKKLGELTQFRQLQLL